MEDCDRGVDLAFRTEDDCSLDGGAGGNSGSEVFELSPNGPRGPRESSTASSRVACAPTFRGGRKVLPRGDLDVGEGDDTEGCDDFDCDAASAPAHC